ncbi:hypothetical protein B0H11DRAFT_2241417 [Mycena galericulata]|nr:hypothetical protein B0H11DRAFT_2241417 [Mycena galericulata]
MDDDPRSLSAQRAAAYVREAKQERERTGADDFKWDLGRAARAFRCYARPRLSKIQRARSRRWERLQFEQRLLNPPPPMPTWEPELQPWPTHGPDPSPGWRTLTWEDTDPGRDLRESDDEISPAVVTRPLPQDVNYFYDYY